MPTTMMMMMMSRQAAAATLLAFQWLSLFILVLFVPRFFCGLFTLSHHKTRLVLKLVAATVATLCRIQTISNSMFNCNCAILSHNYSFLLAFILFYFRQLCYMTLANDDSFFLRVDQQNLWNQHSAHLMGCVRRVLLHNNTSTLLRWLVRSHAHSIAWSPYYDTSINYAHRNRWGRVPITPINYMK